jgi:hypothetical protein
MSLIHFASENCWNLFVVVVVILAGASAVVAIVKAVR